MLYEEKLITNPPQNVTAQKLLLEFQQRCKENLIDIEVCSVVLRPKGDHISKQENEYNIEKWIQFMDKQTYWWKLEYKYALIENKSKVDQIVYPRLLNEQLPFLSKFQDYCLMIEQVLQKSQEEFIDVPTFNPCISKKINQLIAKEDETIFKECYLKLLGTPQQFKQLKMLSDNQQLILFGEQVTIKKPLNCNVSQMQTEIYTLEGEQCQVGYLAQKFYTYWSFDLIRKHFSQMIEILNVKLIIINEVGYVFFDLKIHNIRLVHFKIKFNLVKGKQKQEVNGNFVCSDGSVIVEKNQAEKQMHFFFKIDGFPQCYIAENLFQDEYHEPLSQKWYRTQNFLFNDLENVIMKNHLKISSWIRFTVNYEQSKNKKFQNFCQMIEREGFLKQYHPATNIIMKKASEFPLSTHVPQQVIPILGWQLLSSMFGKFRLVQPTFSIELFMQSSQDIKQERLAEAIQEFKNSTTHTYQANDFLKNLQHRPTTIQFKTPIMCCYFTPSTIIPNYCCNEYFPLMEAILQLSGKKQQQKQILILKVSLRDENKSLINNSIVQDSYQFQNKILICSYFRQQLKQKLNLLNNQYEFIGISTQSLKKHNCYFIQSDQANIVRQHMFQQLGLHFSKIEGVVECIQFQKILNEYFQEILKIISIEKLQIMIGEQPFLVIKANSKHPSRMNVKENKYNFKLLQAQGKVTQDVLQRMNKQVRENENDDYCCFVVRYQNFKGILIPSKNPNKTNKITLYEKMMLKYSPTSPLEVNKWKLNTDRLNDLQIIAVSSYKTCILEAHQLLNIIQSNYDSWKTLKKYYKYFMDCKIQMQNPQQEKEHFMTLNESEESQQIQFYQQFLEQNHKQQTNIYLPIKNGANLMGIYDGLLEPDEVFIQIGQQERLQIIDSEYVLLFKKRYLNQDGLQVFKIVKDAQKIQKLSQVYKNVIVFSGHLSSDRFPYDQYEKSQRFIAIWDKLLVPELQAIYSIDCKSLFQKLRFSQKSQQGQDTFSSLTMNIEKYEYKLWLETLQYQIIDYFTLFQSSQNYEELKQIYCKIKYAELKNEEIFDVSRQIFQQAYNDIIQANLKYLWYADSQASLPLFGREVKNLMKQLRDIDNFLL